jgi:hypothetical protein
VRTAKVPAASAFTNSAEASADVRDDPKAVKIKNKAVTRTAERVIADVTVFMKIQILLRIGGRVMPKKAHYGCAYDDAAKSLTGLDMQTGI